ncbi:hypothetical protein AURDEDRAFT_161626 [Auricularia subglabra TFB-10046 SS5]|nr:hypothetical protein AURDEDRAFT_161626 [Auricularia subglabra TFB-10046 SS5]
MSTVVKGTCQEEMKKHASELRMHTIHEDPIERVIEAFSSTRTQSAHEYDLWKGRSTSAYFASSTHLAVLPRLSLSQTVRSPIIVRPNFVRSGCLRSHIPFSMGLVMSTTRSYYAWTSETLVRR